MEHPTEELWAWLDEPDEPDARPRVDAEKVTCVIVAYNAEEWLGRHLEAFAALRRRPGRVIAVDNGSSDATGAILETALRHSVVDELVHGEKDLPFGVAVQRALGPGEPEWLWLLHDDCAPRHSALEELLIGAYQTQADVLYPKLLQPPRRNYPDALAEIGQSMSRGGARVISVDTDEIDQSQSLSEPVLGGSTAGMLVRGSTWRELGGLSPDLPRHRDGVDFGWRANAMGKQVITWPDAAIMHRQASRHGEREQSEHPHVTDRLTALRVAATRGDKPAGRLGLRMQSLGRAIGFLFAKSPSTASAELKASRRFAADRQALARLREMPSGTYSTAALQPGKHWGLGQAFDRLGSGIADRFRELSDSSGSGTSIDALTGDDFADRTNPRLSVSSLLLMVLLLTATGAVGARHLFGAGEVMGGGLMPAPETLGAAWDAYLQPNPGQRGSAAPWLGPAALLSSIMFASPRWFALAGLVLAPLFAGLAFHSLLRRMSVPVARSVTASLVWAGTVMVLGLITAGDISGMILAITGPMFVRACYTAYTSIAVGAEALRAPAGAAFWLLLSATVWPMALLLVTAAALGVLIRDRRSWPSVLVGVLPAWVFMAPWLPRLFTQPGRWLTGADPLAWQDIPPADSALLAGRILPSGFPWWVNAAFFGVLVLLTLYAATQIHAVKFRLALVAGLGFPLLFAAALSRVSMQVAGGMARPLMSPWALMVVAVVIFTILVTRGRRSRPLPEIIMGLAGVFAAGIFMFFGYQGPVGLVESQLPAYVTDVINSPRHTRVLMINQEPTGELTWNVVDSEQPQWGTGERPPMGVEETSVAELVHVMSGAQTTERLNERLQELGFSHVWMRGFTEDRLAAVGNSAGLTRAAADDRTVVWTLNPPASRIAFIDENGVLEPIIETTIEAADQDRKIALAELPDDRLELNVGGTQLAPAGEPRIYTLPAGKGGEVRFGMPRDWTTLAIHIGVIAVLALISAPTLNARAVARRGIA